MASDFGRKIKDARKQVSMSQRELADAIRLDYGYLSKIERGKVAPPSENVILRVCEVLDLDRDEVLFLARKAPSDLEEIITEGPYIPGILRRARGLSQSDWKDIERLIMKKKRERDEEESD